MSLTYISAGLRREIIERAGNCCEYCRISQNDQFFSFEIDHIISEKHGGSTISENLCLSCSDCNAFKGSDIASVDWSNGETIAPLFHPRKHIWDEHFQIDMTTGKIEPLTPEGRVTLFLLRINNDDRRKDRELLIQSSRYPCGGHSSGH